MSTDDLNDWRPLTHVNGLRLIGEGRVKERARTEQGLLLEIVYPAGVASPLHNTRTTASSICCTATSAERFAGSASN